MLDFLVVASRRPKKDVVEIFPKFILGNKPTDLMTRGQDFYAIWNESKKLWSTEEETAIKLIDRELDIYAEEHKKEFEGEHVKILHMWDSDTGSIDRWHKFVQKQMRDSYHSLDERVIFANEETNKESYASKKLPYAIGQTDISAYDELISVLYTPEERKKIEWAIGAIISGDSKKIQKFVVMYGAAGTGKSTILNIIQDLFQGYYSVFDARALGSSSNSFALEAFKSNPLVAIQHDGDLSHIEDNTRLNSLVSHELMTVNEKFKAAYANAFNAFLFMGTNKPVKITDAKSGIIRRLIDISPTGDKVSGSKYRSLTSRIKHELGGIAEHCLNVYLDNKNAYDDYIPVTMLGASNDFYNFVMDSYDIFKKEDGTTLKAAWEMYKTYCEDANVLYPYSQRVFKEELKNYFKTFRERAQIDEDLRVRNYYSEFIFDKFAGNVVDPELYEDNVFKLNCKNSLLDDILSSMPAQYASQTGTPAKAWANVTTTLADISTSELHYVKVPENHIVIDFDIKDKEGNKSYKLNAAEAAKWPPTYAELSKGGQGIHLHYIYAGDTSKLSNVYDENIEIKVFKGNASLRRKLTRCNNLPIATISSGLPLRKEPTMVNETFDLNEKGIRTIIKRNLNKEYLPGTKPSIVFIFKILTEAKETGVEYDVSDMKDDVMAFAKKSSHHSEYCVDIVEKMPFASGEPQTVTEENSVVFFDVEVFPNLFVIVWKGIGKQAVTMINPTPAQVESLLKFKLVGFNNRKYDNHILYARLIGYTNEQLYILSQAIVSGKAGACFREAYNLSYADIYDFSSKKQGLKKWEIELGIHHQELGLPWDQPVDESLWEKVAEYCINDVVATEAVWNACQSDWTARKILSDISGLTPNDTTRMHTTKIIFGTEKHPKLNYTDLSTIFPGYSFENGKSNYRGEDPGEGGYVYANPGVYRNVALLDIASMHPSSIIALDLFGEYTPRFKDIMDARLYIKHRDFSSAGSVLNGALKPYLKDEGQADSLAKALKLAINSVYGYTTATFDNPFKDERNVDNIVAKRGSLFMINLKHEVESRGYTVAHIKTDSIKIPDATQEIIDFVMEYGRKYGYNFEHEATYDRICLVNHAVYIAKYDDQGERGKGGKHANQWTATGTQFQVPYVFKTLFSKEDIEFSDLCETKTVKEGQLYLDFCEGLPEGEHNFRFVGSAGSFCPIKPGYSGGSLYRLKDGKYYAAPGTKGYLWKEAEVVKAIGEDLDHIDISYYDKLCDEAVKSIEKFEKFEIFVA